MSKKTQGPRVKRVSNGASILTEAPKAKPAQEPKPKFVASIRHKRTGAFRRLFAASEGVLASLLLRELAHGWQVVS